MTIDNKDMIDIDKDNNQDQALKESLHEHGVKVSLHLHLHNSQLHLTKLRGVRTSLLSPVT